MAALGATRVATRLRKTVKYLELPAATAQVWKNGLACWDTATGLVTKGAASATLVPIGFYTEDKNVGAGGTVVVELFTPKELISAKNDGTVVAGTLGNLCYVLNDQDVSNTDNTNTRSVAGRVWQFSTTEVWYEPIHTSTARNSGLDI